MNIVVLEAPPCHSLNIRQLLTPLFFSREVTHHNMKRQRSRRQRAIDRRAARELKAAPVPLWFVDPTIYLEQWDGTWEIRRAS